MLMPDVSHAKHLGVKRTLPDVTREMSLLEPGTGVSTNLSPAITTHMLKPIVNLLEGGWTGAWGACVELNASVPSGIALLFTHRLRSDFSEGVLARSGTLADD